MDLRDALDEKAKHREWRFDRILWAVIGGLVLAAAAGLFGSGPLAKGRESLHVGEATYTIEYDRINRRDHVTLLFVEVDDPAAVGDKLTVALSHELTETLTVRSSVPGADGGSVGPEGATYAFAVDEWSSPVLVSFEYLPERSWRTTGHVVVTAGEGAPVTLPFQHFVYP